MLKLNLIVVLIVIGLTAAFVTALALPGSEDLGERREKLDDEIKAVKTKQKQVGDVSRLYASIMELDAQMADYQEILPADRRFGEFLSELSDKLKAARIDDYVVQPRSALRVDPAKVPDAMRLTIGTTVLPVSVSFEGEFSQVFDFLKRLETMKRLIHVESMRIENDEERPGHVTVEMMLHTYRHSGQPGAAA